MEGLPDPEDLIGDWKLDQTLKTGGYNSVVLSWQNNTSGEKIVTKIWSGSCCYRDGCISEIQFHLRFKNKNIISTKELPNEFVAGLAPIYKQPIRVLCMEYGSTNLRQILTQSENSCGLEECDVRQVLQDVKNAVQFLYHNKITHKKLSPEHIVRLYQENTYIYKIIDISMDRANLYDMKYFSPEFVANMGIDSADLWALGLVAFETICGVRPFFPYKEMPIGLAFARSKSHDIICGYETFHGDSEFSCEILPENHISKHFKTLIEEWLKIAVEVKPQLRGRVAPLPTSEARFSTQNLTIFTLLDDIMNTLEVKIFSVFTLEYLSYGFNDLTSMGVLKSKIKESTQIHEQDQLLISLKTNREVDNEDLLISHWENNSSTIFFLFNKKMFLQEHINYIIPRSVSRAITSKTLIYNYNNSLELYRCGCYFVNSQQKLCNEIFKAVTVQAQYFDKESKQLLFQQHSLSKLIGKIEAKHESASYLFESGKQHLIRPLIRNKLAQSFFNGFIEYITMFNSITYNWKKFARAWEHLTLRLQSCTKRISEFSLQECYFLFEKYDYNDVIIAANNAYDNYLKNSKHIKKVDKTSVESIKYACQEALKIKSKLLTELRRQPFIVQMLDLGVEISKLKDTLQTASKNCNKLHDELTEVTQTITDLMWGTFQAISSTSPIELSHNFSDTNNLTQLNEYCGAYPGTAETDDLVESSLMLRNASYQLIAALRKNKTLLKDLTEDFNIFEDL